MDHFVLLKKRVLTTNWRNFPACYQTKSDIHSQPQTATNKDKQLHLTKNPVSCSLIDQGTYHFISLLVSYKLIYS